MKKLVLALTVSLAAATSASAQIRIGVYGAFTGGSAQIGASMRNGVQLAAHEINVQGGILGQEIELVVRDDEATPERGAKIVRELIDREHVMAILGPTNTSVADASVGYASERLVPVIINVTTGAKVNERFKLPSANYVFRLAASDAVQAELVVKEAVDVRGHRKIAIIDDSTGFGRSGEAHLAAALHKRQLTAVYVGSFNLKDTDMSRQLEAAKAAGAEAVLSFAIGPELAALARSMDKLSWHPELLGSWTLGMQVFTQTAGRGAEGATMPQTFIETSARTKAQRDFVEGYHARFGPQPMVLAPAAAQGYDSLYLLKLAIEQAASTEGPKIKDALEHLNAVYDGVTNKYRRPWSPTDHEAIDAAHVTLGRVKGGRVVPAWEF